MEEKMRYIADNIEDLFELAKIGIQNAKTDPYISQILLTRGYL